MDQTKVPLVGIVGGIASGKSFVSEHLGRLGAAVISADQLAHDVLRLEDVKRAVREHWGAGVFTAEGEVDRAQLAKIVFASSPEGSRELKYLEQLTHPKIGQLMLQQVSTLGQQKTAAAIVLDVPLMFESGWNRFCDRIVFVDAPREVRLARATARGWAQEDFDRREAAQESLETKRKLADVVIDNSGSSESAQAQIERFWHSLTGPFNPTPSA